MSTFFETVMLICFGLSWPLSIAKSIKSKTAKGKSMFFQIAIIIGYTSGIAGKLMSGNYSYVTWLYALNLFMVTFDLFLYFRNLKTDKKRAYDSRFSVLSSDKSI